MKVEPRIIKRISFFFQPATVACDANCEKAWGSNTRPTVKLDPNNEDDWAYLSDNELGYAPDDPGTFEGNDTKPIVLPGLRGPDTINKWCVRECERMKMTSPGKPHETPELPDFSERVYNLGKRRKPLPPEADPHGVGCRFHNTGCEGDCGKVPY